MYIFEISSWLVKTKLLEGLHVLVYLIHMVNELDDDFRINMTEPFTFMFVIDYSKRC